MSDLDPRMTFDSFVVGPANRLASAAARRAADSPAASYNPLFLYSASGLGKSHILTAMAHHAERLNPDSNVRYQTIEGYLEELARATEEGTQEAMRDRYHALDMLLLDDVQFLTGQPEAQELLLRTLDSLNASRGQIVLASDRPPAEIDGLDNRLLSRFSGGLMVDIAPPEYETRAAIVRRKLDERQGSLASEAVEVFARLPFRNVRELQGGLNRLLAVQDVEGRQVRGDEVAGIVDVPRERTRADPRISKLSSFDYPDTPDEPWQQLIREAAQSAEAEGFSAARLRRVLEAETEPSNADQIVANFTAVLTELRQIKADLDMVGNPWPEAARGVLTDPERLDEARALLASARERMRDFPPFPDDVALDALPDAYPELAVRAAHQLIRDEPPEYNPLYVYSQDGFGARGLLEAAGTTFVGSKPTARVALISAKEFAEEFITALSEGVAGAWRERWWTVELLMIHEAQGLADTERAQDEFFHLFEAVKRRGARIMIAADRPASQISGIDDRLRSRFEGGLVVDIPVKGTPPKPAEEILAERQERERALATSFDALEAGREVRETAVRPPDADGSGEEVLDPAFQAQLKELEADPDLVLPPGLGKGIPQPLTSIELDANEFPSLLPSDSDRRLMEQFGLEYRTVPPIPDPIPVSPTPEAAPAGPAGPVPQESATAPTQVLDSEAREQLSDQISNVFAPTVEATAKQRDQSSPAAVPEPREAEPARWQPRPENVVWYWPRLEDRIVAEGD